VFVFISVAQQLPCYTGSMHVYFSGIGGTGIGPLALIAFEAGLQVSGSDKQDSQYIDYLRKKGITDIAIDQSYEHIAKVHAANPIDWVVYTSALPMEQPDAPELRFADDNHIRSGKRDAFLSIFLKTKKLSMIGIAGTHGKTTTTAMTIWLLQQIGMPMSYSVGAKISFGEMGHYDPDAAYFVYEADEFDYNFLSFHPGMAVIAGIDWDHPDIYPTRREYYEAFRTFLDQSDNAVIWQSDLDRLGIKADSKLLVLDDNDPLITKELTLPGEVNRRNAWAVANAVHQLYDQISLYNLIGYLNNFPGVSRRFEQIKPHLLYSDYAHTPPKIRGALQTARETAGDNVIVIYEGLHNTRQHFIKEELTNLFDNVKKVYIVPSYLAREDKNLPLLTPATLKELLSPEAQSHAEPAELDKKLQAAIEVHLKDGDLVLCLTAGGGHSLDEWLREHFSTR
jgi:UDP-N-acetylmuramate--alanine ligase